jgi:hypothetical protein
LGKSLFVCTVPEDHESVGAARNAAAETDSDYSLPGSSVLNFPETSELATLVAVLVLTDIFFDRLDFPF